MHNRLQSEAINARIFEHHSQAEWEECAEFFGIEPIWDSTSLYKVAGLRQSYSPYQLFAAWWMTKQSCNCGSVGGGFLSDKMGYGKSAETLMHIVLNRLLDVAWSEVRDSRRERDGRHNPRNAAAGSPCPSADTTTGRSKWCFPCPCTAGITATMQPPPGPVLILAPATLVSNWKTEWAKHIDPNNKLLNMRLLVNQSMTKGEALALQQMTPNAEEFRKGTHASLLKPRENKDGVLFGTPHAHNIVVLMSKQSLASRLTPSDSGLSNTLWSLIAIDEFHDSKNASTIVMRWLFEQDADTSIRFISATPWDKSPKDIQPALQIIQRTWHMIDRHKKSSYHIIEDPDDVDKLTDKEKASRARHLDKASSAFQAIVKKAEKGDFRPTTRPSDKTAQNSVITIMQTCLSPYMIRRTETTMWGERPAVPMPLHEHRDVYAKFRNTDEDRRIQQLLTDFAAKVERDAITNAQSNWDRRQQRGDRDIGPRPTSLTSKTWLSHMRVARLYACFPRLIKHELSGEDLRAEGIVKFYTNADEKTSWVYKHLDDIDKSPKLRVIRILISKLKKDEPMAFFTTGPVGAFVLYMVRNIIALLMDNSC